MWNNFNQSINLIKQTAELEDEVIEDAQANNDIFSNFVTEVMHECENLFSSEEGCGKYLDLNKHYLNFKNIKAL